MDLAQSAVATIQVEATVAPSPPSPPPRRPDVDLIRVSLTWGILFFHTTVAYAPAMSWYVKSFGWTPGLDYLSVAWVSFMDTWQMPMTRVEV